MRPTPFLLVLAVIATVHLSSSATRLPPGTGESEPSAVLALHSEDVRSEGLTETETEGGTDVDHSHNKHHHGRDDHGRDRRCRIDECGWVKRCKDIYVGRICWSIYCYCGSDHEAEISVDDDEATAVIGETEDGGRQVRKDRRCGKDECGWIRWCKHTYIGKVCWNVYCHCHREDAENDGEQAVQAALRRDERCSAKACGWVPECENGPVGSQCGDIFCVCDSGGDVGGVAEAKLEQQFECRSHECGAVERCITREMDVEVCWRVTCEGGCSESIADA